MIDSEQRRFDILIRDEMVALDVVSKSGTALRFALFLRLFTRRDGSRFGLESQFGLDPDKVGCWLFGRSQNDPFKS